MNARCDTCEPSLLGLMPTATLLHLLRQGTAKLLGIPYLPDLAESKVLLLVGFASVLEWATKRGIRSGSRRTAR